MVSNQSNPVQSFNRVFGIFSEVQNGYSFSDAGANADRVLAVDPDYYGPVYSKVLGRLIQSSPWTGVQKFGMKDIRRRFNRGEVLGRGARAELEGLGLPSSTASQVVRQWEDRMPGFDAEGFEGLGEEQIVLRPHQGEQRRASQMERAAAERGGFEESQGELFASVKRKKSKYNGTLVNTFPEGLQGVSPVSASVSHPSIRYQVLCHMVSPERKWMVASALSGELDSRLYNIYQEASGGEDILNIKESGDNGRVRLSVDTGSGVSTEADLGGSLDTGYVVQSIDDPLGIFPEGTEQGDFLEFGTVEVILKSLADTGERDVDADGSWSYDDGVVDSIGSMFIRSAASPGDHIELRFQSDDGSSNKFINMDYSGGPSFSATWGRIGSAGRVTEYPASQWDSYYRQKVAKGYTDVSDGEPLVVRELPRQAPTKKLPSPQLQPNLRKPKPRATQLELFASRRPQISSRFFSGR